MNYAKFIDKGKNELFQIGMWKTSHAAKYWEQFQIQTLTKLSWSHADGKFAKSNKIYPYLVMYSFNVDKTRLFTNYDYHSQGCKHSSHLENETSLYINLDIMYKSVQCTTLLSFR